MYNNVEIKKLTRRVENVLKYIKENPTSDPNCYEMMELTILVANECESVRKDAIRNNKSGIHEDRDVSKYIELQELKDKYLLMMNIRLENLKNLVGVLDPLYKILKSKTDIFKYHMGFDYTEEKTKFMCKLVGVSLYVRQRIRELTCQNNYTDIIYDNEEEFSYLKDYYDLLVARGDKEIGIIAKILITISKCYNKNIQEI